MTTVEPTLEEWRRLYEVAAAFKQAEPWQWMEETDLFGVQNPETGQIGYASIMGMLGEHLALAVYAGTEGLAGFWQMEQDEDGPATFILEVPHWQASWEGRDMVEPEDRRVMDDLGLKFRGRQAWPLFRSYVPGYLPWFLSGEEARFLALALEQGLAVSQRVREDRDLLDNPDDADMYLVRVPKGQDSGLVWEDEWFKPASPAVLLLPSPVSEEELAYWRDQPRLNMAVEVSLFPLPVAIRGEDDARPCYGYALLVVDASSGYVFGMEVLTPRPSLEAVWAQVPTAMLKSLHSLKGLPKRVHVCDERLWELLEPMATELAIMLGLKRFLPALDEAKMSLVEWMR